jgi:hypothetical protein
MKVECEKTKVKNRLNTSMNELMNYFRSLGTVKKNSKQNQEDNLCYTGSLVIQGSISQSWDLDA